jgi:hypothetical protein
MRLRLETGPDQRYARKRVLGDRSAHTLGGPATPAPQAPIKPEPFDMKEWRRRWGAFWGPATGDAIRAAMKEQAKRAGR